jgi:hypothetical protein
MAIVSPIDSRSIEPGERRIVSFATTRKSPRAETRARAANLLADVKSPAFNAEFDWVLTASPLCVDVQIHSETHRKIGARENRRHREFPR